MSRYAYTDKDPTAYTVWWVHADEDADMDCGSFATQEAAEASLPGIVTELLTECADEEREATIRAGSFHLEFPEGDNGERGQTVPMLWPRVPQ